MKNRSWAIYWLIFAAVVMIVGYFLGKDVSTYVMGGIIMSTIYNKAHP